MDTLLQRILSLLTAPPGNLIFHLVLAFSILSSLQATMISRRSSSYLHSGRLMFGLGMLFFGQLVLFLSSGLAWQGLLNPHLFLPPLDRAVALFSLIWITWLWNFPRPARLGDLVTGFLNLVVVLLFLFTYTSWNGSGAEAVFNLSWIDLAWQVASLFILVTGMAILLFSRPFGWGFGLGMLSLSLTGIVAHLLLGPEGGDFAGFIRLSQLAAFPMLPTLLNRLSESAARRTETAPAASALPTNSSGESAFPQKERRRYSSDPRTVHAWLELKEQTHPEKISGAVAKAIGHTMLADLCYVVTGPTFGQVVLQNGYDLVREEETNGMGIEQNQVPLLAGALQRGKSIRINANDSQTPDIRTIGNALGLKDPGSILMIPLLAGETPWGGLLLLSPYSNRQWTSDDQNYLATEIGRITAILQSAQKQIEGSLFDQKPADQLLGLQKEVDQLRQENGRLAGELETTLHTLEEMRNAPAVAAEEGETTAAAMPTADLNALIALQQESQETIAGLQTEIERLQAELQDRNKKPHALTAEEAERLESDLRATLQEVAHLQNELAKANAAVLMLERQSPTANFETAENHEVLAAMTQEMRQPMASILGYTDLLLAESVGILGALQRKFLERIRASTERMRSMLDDLIQVSTFGSGSLELLPKPVELGTIIDGAMADTSGQLREKKITLRVDLPAEMPRIFADRDAIQQIVVHLLQNAGDATPIEGTVTLRARTQQEGGESYLLIQVVDSGGGIQPEFLSRVFNQRYRADKPLIQGLGDTGIGLSIAKTLVEAHGGRIWVDTEAGQTTTFSILLPLRQDPVETALE